MLVKQLPIKIRGAAKTDVRSQFSALCYRVRDGKPQILLVTSRGSGRWILPKGWPMDGMTPAQAAAQEAWEEAGVIGKAKDRCIGLFSYNKTIGDGHSFPCISAVYPVKVKALAAIFPERGQRRRRWFSPKKASARVTEPELARILRDFDPATLR